jgi:hypothetical protein
VGGLDWARAILGMHSMLRLAGADRRPLAHVNTGDPVVLKSAGHATRHEPPWASRPPGMHVPANSGGGKRAGSAHDMLSLPIAPGKEGEVVSACWPGPHAGGMHIPWVQLIAGRTSVPAAVHVYRAILACGPGGVQATADKAATLALGRRGSAGRSLLPEGSIPVHDEFARRIWPRRHWSAKPDGARLAGRVDGSGAHMIAVE